MEELDEARRKPPRREFVVGSVYSVTMDVTTEQTMEAAQQPLPAASVAADDGTHEHGAHSHVTQRPQWLNPHPLSETVGATPADERSLFNV